MIRNRPCAPRRDGSGLYLPRVATGLLVGMLFLQSVSAPDDAHADGGRLRLANVPAGPYVLSVFTEPNPVRRGPFDVSVSIYDAERRRVVPDVRIVVTATAIDSLGAPPVVHPATREQADDPDRYYSAKFDLPEIGRWTIHLALEGEGWSSEAEFEIEARELTPFDRPGVILALGLIPLILVGVWLRMSGSGEAETNLRE